MATYRTDEVIGQYTVFLLPQFIQAKDLSTSSKFFHGIFFHFVLPPTLRGAAVVVFLAIQFLARPLNVMISTLASELSFPERYLLAWIAPPRGIVAASIASFFAIRLEQIGLDDARFLTPLTFTVFIGTVLLQGTTGRIARWLGVVLPESRGFLVVGANLVTRKIAKALVENGVRVFLADTVLEKISKAKSEGREPIISSTSTGTSKGLRINILTVKRPPASYTSSGFFHSPRVHLC